METIGEPSALNEKDPVPVVTVTGSTIRPEGSRSCERNSIGILICAPGATETVELTVTRHALALYDTGVTAEYGDKLITLSTCEYSRTNGRMVIVAKLVVPSAEEVDADAGY